MNRSRTMHSLLMALTLFAVTDAFASNKGVLHIASPEDVAGTILNPGDYTVRWEDGSPTVTLSIMRGKHVVTTAVANVVKLPQASINNSVVTDRDGTGTTRVSQIFFSGKQDAFNIRRPAGNVFDRGGK